jgi:hypothetical protein
MSFWTFLFLCVVAGIGYDIWRRKQLAQFGRWEDRDGQVQDISGGREADLERELAALRERIKVLERIATDDHESKRLSNEIDRLRDG